jgi:hypothetical protein
MLHPLPTLPPLLLWLLMPPHPTWRALRLRVTHLWNRWGPTLVFVLL